MISNFFGGLQAKLGVWLGILGAAVLAVGYAFLKGRSEGTRAGAESVTKQISSQTQKVEAKLDKVDNAPIDFDAALKRLRDRGKTSK